ncbi:MAG TPA: universal stress protein [Labilithrix sp.]|nr:universal stress protein [Labilithrix sp.]
MASIRNILVPFDGSPPAIAALEHALALAEDCTGTHIDVLHVEAPDEFEVGSTAPAAPAARKEMECAMEGAIGRAREMVGDRVARHDVAGDPLRRIVEIASEGHYDLIVMGTHGRVGRLHELLGSVAEGVVRNAPCPVLMVREPGGEYQSFAERIHGRPSLAEQASAHS